MGLFGERQQRGAGGAVGASGIRARIVPGAVIDGSISHVDLDGSSAMGHPHSVLPIHIAMTSASRGPPSVLRSTMPGLQFFALRSWP
jgi:hypothetical protein